MSFYLSCVEKIFPYCCIEFVASSFSRAESDSELSWIYAVYDFEAANICVLLGIYFVVIAFCECCVLRCY